MKFEIEDAAILSHLYRMPAHILFFGFCNLPPSGKRSNGMTRLRVFSPVSGIVSFVSRPENVTDQLAKVCNSRFSLMQQLIWFYHSLEKRACQISFTDTVLPFIKVQGCNLRGKVLP